LRLNSEAAQVPQEAFLQVLQGVCFTCSVVALTMPVKAVVLTYTGFQVIGVGWDKSVLSFLPKLSVILEISGLI